MRIVMHCVYHPPEVGGLESHVFHLGRALVEKGNEVHVVTSRSQPRLPVSEVMEGVHVWRTWLPARNTPGWAAHAAGSTPKLTALARSADVLHAQGIASIVPALVARRVTSAPVVTTFHTSHFLRRANSPFWRPVFRGFVRAADHNLAASSEIAEVAMRLAEGVHVEALTNGVDTRRFRRTVPTVASPAPPRRRIVVPRRLFEKNGVDIFVRALPTILEAVDVEVMVIGDGPERAALEAMVQEFGIGGHIRFLGARPNDEMPGLLSSADLAVFPSRMEATSVAALESMACELPVAASDVGGLPEIVDRTVGGLFEPCNPMALARVVVDLLGRSDLQALGRAARLRVVDQWSNDRLAQRHLDIYQALVERPRLTMR